MRIIAYIGVAMLLVFFAVPAIDMLQHGEWSKAAHALPIFALLAGMAAILWLGAKSERHPERGKIMRGWYGESVSSFFVNCLLKTIDSKIFLGGVALSWLFALLAAYCPTAVALDPAKANVALFASWPVASFVFFVRIKGRNFETNIGSILLTLAVTAIPFYWAYR